MIRLLKSVALVAALLPLAPAQAEEAPDWLVQSELQRHVALMGKLEEGLAPFTTDGCSGGLSWTWRRAVAAFPELAPQTGEIPAWEQCCITHDRAYHNAGGARTAIDSYDARLAADQALRACVSAPGAQSGSLAEALFYDQLGVAMFRAVRFGGKPCSSYSWRWGYGFAAC